MWLHTSSIKHDLSIRSSVASFVKGTTGDNLFLFRGVWIYYDIASVQSEVASRGNLLPRPDAGGYMFVSSVFKNWRSSSKTIVIGANYSRKTTKKIQRTPIFRRDSANFSSLSANSVGRIKNGGELSFMLSRHCRMLECSL